MSESVFEQIRRMAESLSLVDRVALIEELAHSLGQGSADEQQTKLRSLRGAWRGRFPEDADLDSALHEIRTEWERELLDVNPVPRKREGIEGR
jgi:hypothetical protein